MYYNLFYSLFLLLWLHFKCLVATDNNKIAYDLWSLFTFVFVIFFLLQKDFQPQQQHPKVVLGAIMEIFSFDSIPSFVNRGA